MIEYCQVRFKSKWDDKDSENILVEDGAKCIMSGQTWMEVFNRLGKDNWKMCGSNRDMVYFMREVK